MLHQLQLEQIACQRGDKVLFTDLSLTFKSGDFVQIEGHNGMGKTSLLRIITGLALPLTGRVQWNGEDISLCREQFHTDLLYLGHLSGVKPELTAWENLRFYQKISTCEQSESALWQALETVGLAGREDIAAGRLSAGQQKRIGLARLWLSQAPLWILDEPFNAIDKHGVTVLTEHFERHVKNGGIVILTSHQDVPSRILHKVRLDFYKFLE
ncbi:cytochrome c biogenesis heme-transporting ATPase CcmA [Bisgaard Taxon 10/6]|uniref:cytochrome c biogenesis heme-transporting ATPase CcmA n=1 Tax=Exercitatus varius TaxID=67857 RepID=UPI00294B643A|nr:cytochrome c biogenesis heme-transporting ATPase CcmA [Exercitatus varius]MDG2917719.1 cytochrome c biogenesis heme-transporting ATPase CcmA [Exercitatus varius]MDG2941688.1 cytochrome c biogenesis heme-transporting ATPase CcmA [Exercitatus varius]MDG2947561.1 cytochrome c biogenesis heme-transporting ATPase CcmA [Exercitatus varius]MDG2952807.1 cytochrome c biogenesis heme-transporting ATPase CcmA [Exercitatus varius]MDG2961779.1 cytochrome c biogenesis heme-transporting ATPase CcmA [Exerc